MSGRFKDSFGFVHAPRVGRISTALRCLDGERRVSALIDLKTQLEESA